MPEPKTVHEYTALPRGGGENSTSFRSPFVGTGFPRNQLLYKISLARSFRMLLMNIATCFYDDHTTHTDVGARTRRLHQECCRMQFVRSIAALL